MSVKSKGRGGPNLDDLMMSYADLNSNSRGGRGFKGPPVKDIKQGESRTAKYESSAKSRDWRTLDQNLESAFSDGNSSFHSPMPQINPIGDIGNFFSATPNSANSKSVNKPSNPVIEDDWGDFQGFATPSPGQPPKTAPKSVNNSYSSNRNQVTPVQASQSSNQVFQWPSPLSSGQQTSFTSPSTQLHPSSRHQHHQPNHPSGAHAAKNQNLNSYVSPSQSILTPMGTSFSTASPHSYDELSNKVPDNNSGTGNSGGKYHVNGSPTDFVTTSAKESVGCRLASFQEESPVHRFKPTLTTKSSASKQTVTPKLSAPDDDFGDFTSSTSTSSQSTSVPYQTSGQSLSLPPSINIVAGTPTQQQNTHSSLTPAVNSGQDKYSALRDLFNSASDSPSAVDSLDVSGVEHMLSPGPHNTSGDNLINANGATSRHSLSPLPTTGDQSINSQQLNSSSDHLMSSDTRFLAPSPSSFNTSGPAGNASPGVFNSSSGPFDNSTPTGTTLTTPSQGGFNSSAPFNTSSDKLVNSSLFSKTNPFIEAAFNSTNDEVLPPSFSSFQSAAFSNTTGKTSTTTSAYPLKNDLKPIKDIASKLTGHQKARVDDDFGDFVESAGTGGKGTGSLSHASAGDEYDEWSLPSTAPIEPVRPGERLPIKSFGVTMSKSGVSNIPYFSSSPPLHSSTPPPLEQTGYGSGGVATGGSSGTCDLEFELPSEQLQLPDKVVFGVSQKQKPKQDKTKNIPPTSLTEILKQTMEQKLSCDAAESSSCEANKSSQPEIDVRLASVDLNAGSVSRTNGEEIGGDLWKQDDVFAPDDNQTGKSGLGTSSKGSSKSPDSPQSLRLPSISPETGSVASLELDLENKLSVGDQRKSSRDNTADLVDSWLDLCYEINNVLINAANNYRNIESAEVKSVVLNSAAGMSYLENIREVYLVFLRIRHSVRVKSVTNSDVLELCKVVSRSWSSVLSETNSSTVLSQVEDSFQPGEDNSPRTCGVCLCATNRIAQAGVGSGENLNLSVIAWNGREYHAACANFWVNCINSELVSLAK